MDIKAESKYVRVSPRKLKLVADSIKGLPLKGALETLAFLKKKATQPLIKILKSATASAVHNFKLKEEDLKIRSIEILKGPMMKRWRPVSRGRTHQYFKRTSHIKITLEEKSKIKTQNAK